MKRLTTDMLIEVLVIDKRVGLHGDVARLIREKNRKPGDKPALRVFDEEGFEIIEGLDYAPDLATIKAECGFGWNDYVTDENFPRKSFEQGIGQLQSKVHAPNRVIWPAEALVELGEMQAFSPTIREGVAWALKHDVNEFPKDIVIPLYGSAQRNSDGSLGVPCLYQDGGQWYVSCSWGVNGRWDADAQFLAVRRKFQR